MTDWRSRHRPNGDVHFRAKEEPLSLKMAFTPHGTSDSERTRLALIEAKADQRKAEKAAVKEEIQGHKDYLRMAEEADREGRREDAKVFRSHATDEARHAREDAKIVAHPDASSEKFYHPVKERGWHKDQGTETRRHALMASTDHRKSRHDRYLEAARAIGELANVTEDSRTKELAHSDSEYFYELARKT